MWFGLNQCHHDRPDTWKLNVRIHVRPWLSITTSSGSCIDGFGRFYHNDDGSDGVGFVGHWSTWLSLAILPTPTANEGAVLPANVHHPAGIFPEDTVGDGEYVRTPQTGICESGVIRDWLPAPSAAS